MSTQPYVTGPAPGHSHTHTIILLHGRDSNAADFACEFFECEVSPEIADRWSNRTLPAVLPTIRWVFPQAQQLPSERFGTDMCQWFDIWSMEHPQQRSEIQVPGLMASIERVREVIRDEEELVPRERIFLGGISQGFATALATFFADGKGGFAALLGFCSWFPVADAVMGRLAQLSHEDNNDNRLAAVVDVYRRGSDSAGMDSTSLTDTPILLQHSRDDEVIPVAHGRFMADMLRTLQFRRVYWHEYEEGGHWINEPEGVDRLFDIVEIFMETSVANAEDEACWEGFDDG